MPVKATVTREPKTNRATPLASPAPFSRNEDKEVEYEEQAAQEEYEQKIREDYKEEMTQEVLEEHGEDYTVWVSTDAPDIQTQIGTVARAIGSLVKVVKSDNQLPAQPAIMTEIERQQLIAILEAALAELKAPFVDRGRFKNIKGVLSKGAEKAATNKASDLVKAGFDKASEAVSGLCDKLTDGANFPDLWS